MTNPTNAGADTRNSATLQSFIDYCHEHPHERFWQALRNWSGYRFVTVCNFMDIRSSAAKFDPPIDTFNWEGRRHDD